jgi:HSP20 family protein
MSMSYSDSRDQSDRAQSETEHHPRARFSAGSWLTWAHTQTWQPPTDVYETDEAVVVRVEIAGMQESDFKVVVQDRLLIITGQRSDPSPKVAYHQLEVRYGEFRCEVYLHWIVDEGDITATYQNGFLEIRLPKARSRRVHVVDASGREL